MIRTGREENDGRTFTRQLLGDYLPEYGLSKYIAFDDLKQITKLAANAKTPEDREKHAKDFFSRLKESFLDVKAYLHDMEVEAASLEKQLRLMTTEAMRQDDCAMLLHLYAHLHRVDRYRELNVAGFAKVLEKFLKRVAVSSLELQAKLRKADDIIATSILSVPTYPTAHAKELAAAMYSMIENCTLEEAFATLDKSLEVNPEFVRRVVPLTAAHHYRERAKHQQLQGKFAAKVLAGTSNPGMAKHICAVMRSSAMLEADVGRFANGEVSLRLSEAVRADDVYVVQSMAANNHDTKGHNMSSAIIELLLALQCATLASCARLTAVIPYMAYSKRTDDIAAIAEMMGAMGCHRVITVDLFAEQVEGMFSVPVDNVSARDEFITYLLSRYRLTGHAMTNLVAVSPNADNVARARRFADRLMKLGKLDATSQFVGVASAVKRIGSDEIDVAGAVEGKECIIVDNVVDEAYNVTMVAKQLRSMGAASVKLVATHAILSGDGPKRLKEGLLDEIIVTDSIAVDHHLRDPALARLLRVLPLAPLLAGVIDCLHSDINAVSELLEK